ncbi:MAG: hypothetical protein DMF81_24550 [Acidobacteria bacterium]|nr:MAG: hypothetical protein DMF81_24550 [Acidobacteriota bacterium]
MKKDEAPDLKEIVALLESEVGFTPVMEVTIAANGRIARREGGLVLDVGGGRTYTIRSVDPAAGAPLNLVWKRLFGRRAIDCIVFGPVDRWERRRTASPR